MGEKVRLASGPLEVARAIVCHQAAHEWYFWNVFIFYFDTRGFVPSPSLSNRNSITITDTRLSHLRTLGSQTRTLNVVLGDLWRRSKQQRECLQKIARGSFYKLAPGSLSVSSWTPTEISP